ncbi:MAG: aquaporin [Verrucomicrobia bacterium]|nr:aquaporin [Verrucomicrobiota bacterium]
MKDFKAILAELIGTFALVFIAVGAVHNASQQHMDLLGIAMAQGLAVAAMVSAIGVVSGGHLNPAVTFGAVIGGKMEGGRAAAYIIAQLAGAVAAGLVCLFIFGKGATSAATPDLGQKVSAGIGILTEGVLTFFWVFAMFGTMLDPRAPKLGGLAVGFVVAVGVLFGGPITGAAMNPARAVGPGLVSGHLTNHLVYWIGPMLGGAVAGLLCGRLLMKPEPPPLPGKK